MRSVPLDDATARSRIRDAAIDLFGSDGFDATSVRAVAKQAGVSPALVIHHFESKDKLRLACDDHIVHQIVVQNAKLDEPALTSTLEHWLSDIDQFRPIVNYLSRMLTDDTRAGDLLFDKLVARTEEMITDGAADGTMNPGSDPHLLAAVVTANSLATLVFGRHIGRAVGESHLTDSVIRQLTIPTLELYTNGLYADDTVLRATREAIGNIEREGKERP
jgi:AcrR family transcriptional regulator